MTPITRVADGLHLLPLHTDGFWYLFERAGPVGRWSMINTAKFRDNRDCWFNLVPTLHVAPLKVLPLTALVRKLYRI